MAITTANAASKSAQSAKALAEGASKANSSTNAKLETLSIESQGITAGLQVRTRRGGAGMRCPLPAGHWPPACCCWQQACQHGAHLAAHVITCPSDTPVAKQASRPHHPVTENPLLALAPGCVPPPLLCVLQALTSSLAETPAPAPAQLPTVSEDDSEPELSTPTAASATEQLPAEAMVVDAPVVALPVSTEEDGVVMESEATEDAAPVAEAVIVTESEVTTEHGPTNEGTQTNTDEVGGGAAAPAGLFSAAGHACGGGELPASHARTWRARHQRSALSSCAPPSPQHPPRTLPPIITSPPAPAGPCMHCRPSPQLRPSPPPSAAPP